jgi:hypothetical protein
LVPVEIVVVAVSTALLLAVPIRIQTQDVSTSRLANDENFNNMLEVHLFWQLKLNSTGFDQSATFYNKKQLHASLYGCPNQPPAN